MAFFAPAVSGFQSFGTDFDGASSGRMAAFAAASQGKSPAIDFDGAKASALFNTAKTVLGMAQKAARTGEPGTGNACLQAAQLLFRYIQTESERPEPDQAQLYEAGVLIPKAVMLAEENGANKEALGQFCYDYAMFILQNANFDLVDDETKNGIVKGLFIFMKMSANLGNADAAEFLENLDDED